MGAKRRVKDMVAVAKLALFVVLLTISLIMIEYFEKQHHGDE